jgi:L-fucose/D-arabinose isomerase
MAMAKGVAKLLTENLRHANGLPVECVIADGIGGVAEAAGLRREVPPRGRRRLLTVTPCWCYGAETMDMDPLIPKAVWGFNGTERPGAVYLAAVLAGHTQKGLPAFSIYGRDVQDSRRPEHPARRGRRSCLQFARAGSGRGDDARQVVPLDGRRLDGHRRLDRRPGAVRALPGHARRVRGHDRVRAPHRRGIYDPVEFEQAWPGSRPTARASDRNPPEKQRSRRSRKTRIGSTRSRWPDRPRHDGRQPALAELGFGEEALGHNAIAGGFQGQRQWTDHFPTATSWRRSSTPPSTGTASASPTSWPPRTTPQRHLHALRPPADRHGPDLRRRAHLLEPGGGQAGDRLRADRATRPAASCT